MYANESLIPIEDDAPYMDKHGTKYPSNWPKDDIPELHKIIETPRPDGATSFTIDPDYNQVWT